MAGLSAVDAGRVHAVCVGLEYFPQAPDGWNLPGAASDALRFARWLRRAGVPASNVSLWLSPVPGEAERLRAEAVESGLVWRETISRDLIMDHFTNTLAQVAGDLLYVYWGGHGMYDQDERWLLFCPEASENDPRCIDAADLRRHMARSSMRGFGQQVYFFDACATFLEHHNAQSSPALARFPESLRSHPDQFSWHAAGPGRVAGNDPAARSGVFSDVLLSWLEGSEGFLPNLSGIRAHLMERFQDADFGHGQTPLYHQILHRGEQTEIGRPDIDRKARNEIMPVLDLLIPDHDRRRVYLGYLEGRPSDRRLDPADVLARLAQLLLMPRKMATLVEMVGPQDSDVAARLLSLGRRLRLPGLLSVSEYYDLCGYLGRVPEIHPRRLLELVGQVLPLGMPAWSAQLPKLDGTLSRLEICIRELERHLGVFSVADGTTHLVPALVRFTEHLAAIFADLELCADLRAWGDRVTERLGVDVGGLRERRRDAEEWALRPAQAAHRPRIVVQLFPESEDLGTARRFSCTIWTGSGAGPLARIQDPPSDLLTPAQVVMQIQRAATELDFDDAQPVVEIVLRLEHIGLPVDTWDGADDDHLVPMILSIERPLVLRCAPLANRTREALRRKQLTVRWRNGLNDAVVCLYERNGAADSAYGVLMQSGVAARTVIYAGRRSRDALIHLALYLGYPVVLWDRDAQPPLHEDHFRPVAPDQNVNGLPERVRAHLAKSCIEPARQRLRPALLLDNPELPLPETPLLVNPATDERSQH